jgi:hypothetical protein
MSPERQAAIERLRKLLAMTVDNGCTEAEAMAAAEKVARLVAEHGLEGVDLAFATRQKRVRAGWNSARSSLWAQIAISTNCAPIMLDGRDSTVEYIGRDPWPDVAYYLHQITDRAIDRALREFKRTSWYAKRRTVRAKRDAARDFVTGMSRRLATKIDELFQPTRSRDAFDQALVERANRYPSEQQVSPRLSKSRYFDAGMAGALAGDGVEISHGVATDARKLLGHGS